MPDPSELPKAFAQPDAYSCGLASAVMYGELTQQMPRVATQQQFNRAINGLDKAVADKRAGWPKTLGTPPWLLEYVLSRGQLSKRRARRVVLRWRSADTGNRLRAAEQAVLLRLQDGQSGFVYVGSRWVPRHVIVVHRVVGELWWYDPSRGIWSSNLDKATGGWKYPWLLLF